MFKWSYVSLLFVLLLGACSGTRPIRPTDIDVPEGFHVEVAVDGLAAPTMIAFDDQGRMIIAESAYGGGGEPKVTRIESNGERTALAQGSVFGTELPITAVAYHDGQVYVVHAGTVSIIEEGGQIRNIITDLPGQGDHQANQLVFQDNQMYLSIGTVTNSAVVGEDNVVFGWLKKPELRDLHDIPCEDIVLTGETFESDNPLEEGEQVVQTSPYAPFATTLPEGSTVPGNPKCNGAVLRANPDGSNLEVVAWGLRNPYGLEIGPDGALFLTMHGFDARGSRHVEDAWDCLYRVEEGAWYGWPDFACEVPVTDPQFRAKDQPQPQFLIANHPTENPPQPIAKFNPHAATNGFAFAPSDEWGAPTDAFIALFGDFTPATGTVPEPQGVKIVRVDTTTGEVTDFITNKFSVEASKRSAGGLEHPSDVTFGPDGAMYITDWGVAHITVDGLKLEPNTGVVWRVTRGDPSASLPGGPSLLYALLGLAAFGTLTVVFARGPAAYQRLTDGLWAGAVAGLVMGVAAMIVSALVLNLPWYAPPRVFATMVMGRAAVANILEFEAVSFIAGLIVVLVLTSLLGLLFAAFLRSTQPARTVLAGVFYGLTVWALLQYFLLPLLFPLVSDKGFPPFWYAVAFGIYGLALGALLARRSGRRHP
ncbi:MAG TPA: PQQ-dependent sugar dehydrogenase [Anaerolineales bacterium]|nr:PQQ-dependent sugar dehydrogenase [Anaerolineales bacterium]